MAAKKSTDVMIAGKVYTLSGYEEEGYLQRVASYINAKISEITEREEFRRISNDMKSILIQLNIADDYFKAKAQFEDMEENYKKAEKDLFELKHELVDTQMKVEELLEKLDRERRERSRKTEREQVLEENYKKLEDKYQLLLNNAKVSDEKNRQFEEILRLSEQERRELEASNKELRLNKKNLEEALADALLGTDGGQDTAQQKEAGTAESKDADASGQGQPLAAAEKKAADGLTSQKAEDGGVPASRKSSTAPEPDKGRKSALNTLPEAKKTTAKGGPNSVPLNEKKVKKNTPDTPEDEKQENGSALGAPSDGVQELVDHAETVSDGMQELGNHDETVPDGMQELGDHAETVPDGTPEPGDHAETVPDGTPEPGDHAETIPDGMQELGESSILPGQKQADTAIGIKAADKRQADLEPDGGSAIEDSVKTEPGLTDAAQIHTIEQKGAASPEGELKAEKGQPPKPIQPDTDKEEGEKGQETKQVLQNAGLSEKELTQMLAGLTEEELAELLAPIKQPVKEPVTEMPRLSEEELEVLLAPPKEPAAPAAPAMAELSKEELEELLAPVEKPSSMSMAQLYEEELKELLEPEEKPASKNLEGTQNKGPLAQEGLKDMDDTQKPLKEPEVELPKEAADGMDIDIKEAGTDVDPDAGVPEDANIEVVQEPVLTSSVLQEVSEDDDPELQAIAREIAELERLEQEAQAGQAEKKKKKSKKKQKNKR